MNRDKFKWIYTYVLLAGTIGWARFCVTIVLKALETKADIDILAAAGVMPLLGALIVWCTNVNFFWFRKKGPTEEPQTPSIPLG